jgi:hypothetical protein
LRLVAAAHQRRGGARHLVGHLAQGGDRRGGVLLAVRQADGACQAQAQAGHAVAAADAGGDAFALAHQLAQHAGEVVGRDQRGQQFEVLRRCLPGRQHRFPRVREERRRFRVLQHRELRRQPGLQREGAEQGLAEGMDGGDAHAPRQLQHLREQPARAAAERLARRAAERLELRVQPRVVGAGPGAEAAGEPRLHLRRRRLGEGEAEDAVRRLALLQQEAQHAVGQHLGLARAGRGSHPGRDQRIGGGVLREFRLRSGAERDVHEPASASSAPDHSARRERWS